MEKEHDSGEGNYNLIEVVFEGDDNVRVLNRTVPHECSTGRRLDKQNHTSHIQIYIVFSVQICFIWHFCHTPQQIKTYMVHIKT